MIHPSNLEISESESNPSVSPNLSDRDRSVISTYGGSIAAASSGALVGGLIGTAIGGPLGGIIGSGLGALGCATGVASGLFTNALMSVLVGSVALDENQRTPPVDSSLENDDDERKHG